jgi:septum formation protein
MTAKITASFWLDRSPLVLASKSKGRRLALEQTAIPFVTHPAEVDERGIEADVARAGGGADEIAARLAREKALVISRERGGQIVLGADQVASCEGRLLGKPADAAKAREQLRFLSGRDHRLHSAVALVRDGVLMFETVSHANLRVRPLSEGFIDCYLAIVGDEVTTSAGAYQIEGLGIHLFESIRGDHWTIIGLPLMPVLDALRREGVLLA